MFPLDQGGKGPLVVFSKEVIFDGVGEQGVHFNTLNEGYGRPDVKDPDPGHQGKRSVVFGYEHIIAVYNSKGELLWHNVRYCITCRKKRKRIRGRLVCERCDKELLKYHYGVNE